ncbi:Flap endonuclease 1-A [Sesamum angolense]|uniref:Flap endonuclease 1 n=1 Tax=Sesamum angolense TaxID=2727404 RepID=A0AAE2C2M2_9LAMI|nr:Flap endonuclease 1-A [Sesamum angolense]
MGIKGLTKLLADNAPMAIKEQKLESYFGREIAIDASMSIYQFLVVVGRRGAEMLTNEAGEVTSHLLGMFTRTIRLMEAGIKPVYVFDGKPPDLKKQELAKRFSRRADATKDLNEALKGMVRDALGCLMNKCMAIRHPSLEAFQVTEQHNEDCKKLLRLMGVPVIEAPCEAEAQCAALCRADKVFAVASEDMDSLTFGAPRFLRHLMGPSSKKIPVLEFEVSKVLEELNLNMDQFIDLCILAGCDYCDSIRGIGGLTALKLIRQHGSIEHILENINKQRLGSFSKPVVSTSVTAKGKGTKCVLTVPKPVTKLTWYSTGASFHSRPKGIGNIAPSVDLGSKQSMPFSRSLCCAS